MSLEKSPVHAGSSRVLRLLAPALTRWTVPFRVRRGPLLLASRPMVLSVGCLAWGGRAKTALVAALSTELTALGLRAAVAARSLEGRSSVPTLLRPVGGGGPSWLRLVGQNRSAVAAPEAAREHGAEGVWLALEQPGPTAVARTLDAAVAALAAQAGPLDLILLDDGFQASIPRHADLVVTGPRDDGSIPLREPPAALASVLFHVGLDGAPAAWPLSRRPGPLVGLRDGQPVPVVGPPRWIVAGVGDPASVSDLAHALGVATLGALPVRDHGRPGPLVTRRVHGSPLLITEKDALGWAALSPPSDDTAVLLLRLDGVPTLAKAVAEGLC